MNNDDRAASQSGIPELIDHARGLVRHTPGAEAARAAAGYRARFDAAANATSAADLHVFAFHAEVPESHRLIDYVDVTHDHGDFDYCGLASHLIWASRAFNREQRVRLIYVTDATSRAPEPSADLTVIRLPLDARALMFERVQAMNAYVHSHAFCSDTVFLDTDAYPNRALGEIFARNVFDIGVTFRTTPGYMPLNEGVIFGSRTGVHAVRRFFDSYLATYEVLRQDRRVMDYYGNIDRWRGGQLALNAVACPPGDPRATTNYSREGIDIRLFPCDEFNYWVTTGAPAEDQDEVWNRKFILHLKGDSKVFLPSVEQYQKRRVDGLHPALAPVIAQALEAGDDFWEIEEVLEHAHAGLAIRNLIGDC